VILITLLGDKIVNNNIEQLLTYLHQRIQSYYACLTAIQEGKENIRGRSNIPGVHVISLQLDDTIQEMKTLGAEALPEFASLQNEKKDLDRRLFEIEQGMPGEKIVQSVVNATKGKVEQYEHYMRYFQNHDPEENINMLQIRDSIEWLLQYLSGKASFDLFREQVDRTDQQLRTEYQANPAILDCFTAELREKLLIPRTHWWWHLTK
jgi:hypothetical protein